MISVASVNDANWRFNERLLEENADIRREVIRFVQADLYIDSVPDPSLSREQSVKEGTRNQQMLERFLDSVAEPAHVLFEFDANQPFKDGLPNGRILARHEGMITNPQEFARMLRDGAAK